MGKHLSPVLETEGCQRIETRICDLPDHLLVLILLFVPTKEAVATSILSKRWRYVWTMLPELVFKTEGSERFGWFINKSLQLHKAPKLDKLIVELGPRCRVSGDVENWAEDAVNRGVEELQFKLFWYAANTRFPKSLYTCKTLVRLTLSNKILVDVSSLACLPSLLDSLARLLSSSPVLENLTVERHKDDNLKKVTVKVSSLKTLFYAWKKDDDNLDGSLVIDSPALTSLNLNYVWEDCSIENIACLNDAYICCVHNPDDKFLRSLSSVIHLHLHLTKSAVACFNAIKFSRLIELFFTPNRSIDWLELLMFLLQISPKLKYLTIDNFNRCLPPSWNEPSSIPGCLLSHLETFTWIDYEGREDEKLLLTYILANSKCLKTVEIFFVRTKLQS